MKKSRIRIALSLTLLLFVAISIQAFAVAGAGENHNHEFGPAVYTGENYHFGDQHHARFRETCITCSYSRLKWVSYRCSGNGGHIVPNALDPIPTGR